MLTKDKNLKNVHLSKLRYDPVVDGDAVITELYVPCLSQSVSYDRLAGFFGSDALKIYSQGLVELFNNEGKARYVFSRVVNQEDLNLIFEAYQQKEKIEMDSLIEELDTNLDWDFNVANLAYLMARGCIEIKISYLLDKVEGMGHWKDGVFTDQYGNKIYISGSSNETVPGLTENGETILVHTNFNGDNTYTDIGTKLFNEIWNNTYKPDTVIAVPPDEALLEKLKSYSRDKLFASQEEFDEFNGLVVIDIDTLSNKIVLYDKTDNHLLANPRVISLLYGDRMENVGSNKYTIEKITLHDLRDVLPDEINGWGKNYRYTDRAMEYIAKNNLQIEERTKIAKRVKARDFNDLTLREKYNNFKKVIDYETVARLKDDQYLNAFHHYVLERSLDFSVPGTGKTYIAYGLFAFLNSQLEGKRKVDHLVVFGPLNCFNAWKEECKNIFGDKNDFTIFDITEHRTDFKRELRDTRYNIYLFNYNFFNKDRSENEGSLRQILDDNTMLVFDEIHRIKGIGRVWPTKITEIISDLPQKPIYMLAMTGTPLPNSFVDLHNYMNILYGDEINAYLRDFSTTTLKQADDNETIAEHIQEQLHPFFTRTTKNDLNIPPANPDDIETLRVTPTVEETELYQLISMSYRSEPFVKFIRLIQAASNPQLVLEAINQEDIRNAYISSDGDDEGIEDDIEEMLRHINDVSINTDQIADVVKRIPMASKTKKTLDLVNEKVHEGKKVIVWCLFIKTIGLVCDELRAKGIRTESISGSDSLSDRNTKLNDFKYGDVQVLVTNPNTLAESVSLHLQCHDAVYLEYGFNLTYMLQSRDRIHRVGLPEGTETNYYYAIAGQKSNPGSTPTIDNRVYERLELKARRMYEAIESGKLYVEEDESELDDIRNIIEDL